jgi:hypothetical protein
MKYPFFDSKEEALAAEHAANERLYWFAGPGVRKYAWGKYGNPAVQMRYFAIDFFGLSFGLVESERENIWTQRIATENAALKEELAKLRDELELSRLKNGQAAEVADAHA